MKRPRDYATPPGQPRAKGVHGVRLRFFEAIYRLVRYHAWWVLFVSLLLSIFALYAIRDLPIKESLLDLLPQDDPLIEQFKLRYEELSQSDSMVVLLQLTNPSNSNADNEATLTDVASKITRQLTLYPEISSAAYQIDGKIATFTELGEDEEMLSVYLNALSALQQSSVEMLGFIGNRLEVYYESNNAENTFSFQSQQAPPTESLVGTKWILDFRSSTGLPEKPGQNITLEFLGDGKISGMLDCIPISGEFRVSDGVLDFPAVVDLLNELQSPCDSQVNFNFYTQNLQGQHRYFYGDFAAKAQWISDQINSLDQGNDLNAESIVRLITISRQFFSEINALLPAQGSAFSPLSNQIEKIRADVDYLLTLVGDLETRLETPVPDISDDGTALRIVVRPSQASFESLKFNQHVLDLVDQALQDFLPLDESIRVYISGAYSFTAESNQMLRVDMFYTTLISIAGIALIFLFTFRGVIYPMLVIIPLSMSAVWTTAWAKFMLDGFNLVTALLPALLLGLGINYGIHFVGRFTEERKRGHTTSRALYETILNKGNAMLSGAVTTALVFLVMLTSQSRGLYEMGVVAAFGVMMSAILTLLVLPSLIVVTHLAMQRWISKDAGYRWQFSGVVRAVLRFRRTVILGVLLVTVSMLSPASEVRIQFVSEDLMAEGMDTQIARDKLREAGFGETEGAGDFFLFFAVSEAEAQQIEAVLRSNPLVLEVQSVSDIFAQTSILQNFDLDQAFGQGEDLVSDLFNEINGTRVELEAQLAQTEEVLRTWRDRFEQFGQRNAVELINEALNELVQIQPGFDRLDLQDLQRSLLQIQSAITALQDVVSRTLVLPETIEGFINELPPEIRSQSITSNNEIIVYAQLSKDVYLEGNYESFIDSVDPIMTNYIGMPMINRQLEIAMERDFWVSTLGAFALIFLSLLIDFAAYRMWIRAPMLVLLPLGLGYIWMLGGMGILNLSFNLTNMVISPLLIGIGVDNGIHLLHRYLENKNEPDRVQRSTESVAMPIIIANLATLAAFGSLVFAATPGLPVLGKSAVIGVGSVAFCSLTLLPAVLARRR